MKVIKNCRTHPPIQIENGFLTELHREPLTEKVLDIVNQLSEDPTSLPKVYLPVDPNEPSSQPPSEEKVGSECFLC